MTLNLLKVSCARNVKQWFKKPLTINAAAADHKHKIQDSDSLSLDLVLSEIIETTFATVFQPFKQVEATECEHTPKNSLRHVYPDVLRDFF